MKNINIGKKFLKDLGIDENSYPSAFYEKIEDLGELASDIEIAYCDSWKYCDGKKARFQIKDVVGTVHSRYAGKTWIEAYFDSDRGDKIIELYQQNPSYWEEMKDFSKTDLGLIKRNDRYYVFDKAGGGNNRLIVMKLMYLSLVAKCPEDLEKINEEFTFSANVREIPKDRDLPYIIMALSENLDFGVNHANGKITLTKKFTDDVLFEGNSEQLKEYFLTLFDVYENDKEVVKRRLNSIRKTFGFNGKAYQEKMGQIIPDLRDEP